MHVSTKFTIFEWILIEVFHVLFHHSIKFHFHLLILKNKFDKKEGWIDCYKICFVWSTDCAGNDYAVNKCFKYQVDN